MADKNQKTWIWLTIGIAGAIIIGAIIISSNLGSKNQNQYVCSDGKTIVTDLNECPKKPRLVVDLDCRATCSQGIGGCTFPDIITGEIKLNAQEKTVSDVTLEYELYSKTDKTVKYNKYKTVSSVDTTSEKSVTFDYTRGDLSEVYDGGVGFPAGMVGMPILLKITCNDCEITSSNAEKVVNNEATISDFCSY